MKDASFESRMSNAYDETAILPNSAVLLHLRHHSAVTLPLFSPGSPLPAGCSFSVTPSLSSSLVLLPINRLQRARHMSARGGVTGSSTRCMNNRCCPRIQTQRRACQQRGGKCDEDSRLAAGGQEAALSLCCREKPDDPHRLLRLHRAPPEAGGEKHAGLLSFHLNKICTVTAAWTLLVDIYSIRPPRPGYRCSSAGTSL